MNCKPGDLVTFKELGTAYSFNCIEYGDDWAAIKFTEQNVQLDLNSIGFVVAVHDNGLHYVAWGGYVGWSWSNFLIRVHAFEPAELPIISTSAAPEGA